ncbi:hypothetical protein M9H77_12558 [Catharanthus roseus]|uniref:Uncharacterized protein n=1 Tax=Catharanthus roseus TaxID=4058 RepID=A0ACC0BHS8_CATRO|nr:hypothetical protein M9H77_12558 [Catharanthus roseus]
MDQDIIVDPIKTSFSIKRKDGFQTGVNFKIDQLSEFCYTCDQLGHIDTGCKDLDSFVRRNEAYKDILGTWVKANGPQGSFSVNKSSAERVELLIPDKIWSEQCRITNKLVTCRTPFSLLIVMSTSKLPLTLGRTIYPKFNTLS